MLKHITIDKEEEAEYCDQEQSSFPRLTQLAKLNIFIGPNNSGKSRLLRNIVAQKFQFISWHPDLSKQIKDAEGYVPEATWENFFSSWAQYNDPERGHIQPSSFWLKKGTVDSRSTWDEAAHDIIYEKLRSDIRTSNVWLTNNRPPTNSLHQAESIIDRLKRFSTDHNSTTERKTANHLHGIYIPLLRGLRPLIQADDAALALAGDNNTTHQVSIPLKDLVASTFGTSTKSAFQRLNDLYQTATLRDYPLLKARDGSIAIYTGLSIYWDLQRLLLGKEDERRKVREFESYLSHQFFERAPIELVPSISTPGILNVKIGADRDHAIHNLGDGLQSIIIILYPIFTQLKEDKLNIVGIEEPEINLHPGLQRQLIEALFTFPNTQFFITTHSNHLLEILEDYHHTSIFRIERINSQKDASRRYTRIEQITSKDDHILSSLGVLNSSVFLSNCTIWVEGITDRKLFRHYLKIYLEHLNNTTPLLIEDKHYSFVEYGGSNITHWSFLEEDQESIKVERLCGKLLLIADGDNATGKKASRQEKLREKLQDRFILLDCKETENLLSPKIIDKIISESIPSDSNFVFSKSWFSYKNKPLGQFIENHLESHGISSRRKFSSGNTIKYKGQFIESAITHTTSWDYLTEEAQKTVKIIHDFIVSQNKLQFQNTAFQ